MESFPLLLSSGEEELVQSCIYMEAHMEDSGAVKKTSQIGMDDFFKNFPLLQSSSDSGSENSVRDRVDDFTAYPLLIDSDSELADDENCAGVNNSTDTETSSDEEAMEDSAVFHGKTKKRRNPGRRCDFRKRKSVKRKKSISLSKHLIWKLDELPQFRLNAYDNKDLEVSQSDSSDTEVYLGRYKRVKKVQKLPLREEMKMNTKENEVSSDEDDGIESVDISRLQKRSFVAVDKEEWSNRPQIGQVEEILKDKIKIKWLHGTYNDVFEDCYTTERGKRTLWFEYIPMDKIVMADVQFTKHKRLLKEDRDELKLRYHLYDSRCNIE